MNRFKQWIAAIMWIALAMSVGAAELQWGFAYTSDTVSNQNNGVIVNSGTRGASLDGEAFEGDPSYSADVPNAGDLTNAVGVGSVNTTLADGGTVKSIGTLGDLASGDEILSAGGITIECWTRQLVANEAAGDQFVLNLGGYFVIVSSGPNAVGGWKLLANSSSLPTPVFPLSEAAKVAAGWIHVAGVFATPSGSASGPDNSSSLYINGSLVAQETGLSHYPSLGADTRPITIGSDHNGNKHFEGLVFEPRVSLGALDPSEFTFVLRDDDGDGLPDLWEENFFGDIALYDGNDDPDLDDVNNLEEYFRGTIPILPDSDADGLTDLVETGTGFFVDLSNTGTGPTDSDSDNDGVIDGAEVLIYGSDPFQDDADFDGSPDIVEITVGTDPQDTFDDPLDYFNLLMGSMAVGEDWNEGLFFNFGSVDAEDAWVIGGSGPGFGQLIRSPEGAGTVYPGTYSLIVSGDGAVCRLKQADREVVTIDDLRLRGGILDNGNVNTTQILGGTITVEANTVSNEAEVVTTASSTNVTFRSDIDSVINLFDGSRHLTVDAVLDGTSGLVLRQSVSSASPAVLNIRSLDNPYSGTWTVLEGALLKGGGLNSLGTGDIYLEAGGLDPDYALASLDSTLTLVDPDTGLGGGVLVLDKDHYVGALYTGTNPVAPGTYNAAQLVALAGPSFSNSFIDGGGTVTVTGLGVGDDDGNGIPDAWEVAHFGSNGQDPNSDVDDSDGLTIGHEFAAGTDPKVADSDGDTLNDGAEIFTHGTDPTQQDSDGDSLRDDAELAGADARPPTDPRDADTDGDTLDDGVESNSGTFVDETDTGTDPTDVDSDADLFNDDVEVAAGSDPTDPDSVPLGFSDDFEDYTVSNPADFSATGNWTWNGAGGGTGNDSRIFATGNYGGSQLWICHPTALGSGITSAGIALDPNTLYSFVGNLVAETSDGGRDNEFSVDLLIGADAGSAVSVLGGPVTVIGRGDGNGTNPPDSIDDSYEDQITTIGFNSGAMAPSDRLFIEIIYVGPGPSGNPGFGGVDNISIVDIADADNDLLPDFWEIEHFGNITAYDGTGDPDVDLLDNAGELARMTDPNDPDTDDDGLTDKVETGTGAYVSETDTGTDPLTADTDGDGLDDGVENNSGILVDAGDTGTDPNDADTDGDTFGDGAEIVAGSDPHLISSVPEWCSGAFAVRYEAVADVPSVENASEGWVEADAAPEGAGVVWSNGYLLLDSYDATTNASTAGGLWIENPSGGAWGAAVGAGNPSYTVEVRARVLADAGDFGLAMWSGHQGDPGIAYANITTNAVYWGTTRDQFLSDTNGIDNTTDFHIYRVYYNADASSYSVYRDNVLLADGLGAANPNTQTRMIVGDTGSAGSVLAEVDYVRWDVGVAWTPSPASADCDGDGLLNSQEDVNGNGVVDAGETDEGLVDTDGDWIGDGDEVLVAGTDPTDPDSVLKIIDADVSPTGQLTWSSVPGKTYRIQFTTTMNPPDWADLADIPADATGDSTSVTDPTPAGAEGHYRVLVLADP